MAYIVTAYIVMAGLPVLGFVNPRLYQTAAAHANEALQTMNRCAKTCV